MSLFVNDSFSKQLWEGYEEIKKVSCYSSVEVCPWLWPSCSLGAQKDVSWKTECFRECARILAMGFEASFITAWLAECQQFYDCFLNCYNIKCSMSSRETIVFLSPSVLGPLCISTRPWRSDTVHTIRFFQFVPYNKRRTRGLKTWHTPDPIQHVTGLETFAISSHSCYLTYTYSLGGDSDISWVSWPCSLMQLIVEQIFVYFDKEKRGSREEGCLWKQEAVSDRLRTSWGCWRG